MGANKIFIFDTNILLHDFRSLYKFEENDIVIPMSVIEELDHFKKGNEQINFNARSAIREIEALSGDPIFAEEKGVSLGENRGKLFVMYHKPFSGNLKSIFQEDTKDNRILSVASYLRKRDPNRYVALVSKDINLRMKAKSIKVNAEDYKNDAIKDLKTIHKHSEIVENISKKVIDLIYANNKVDISELENFEPIDGCNYYIFQSESSSALVYFNKYSNTIQHIEKTTCFGIKPRNAEQAFAFHTLLNDSVKLVSLTGKAGTGKTLLALAACLAQSRNYTQILLARPIVSLSDKDLGFLPGTVDEKIGPYMQPLFDNLGFIKSQFSAQSTEFAAIENSLKNKKLVISPLAYIRGRSLSNILFIIDEAQNLTPHEIKTIITRAGENTKIIFTGDIQQIDSPYLDEYSNGLSYLSDKMLGQHLFEHINLVHGERSELAELATDLL